MNKLREQFVGQKGYHSVEEDVSVGDGMKQTFYTDAYVEWLEARDKEHLAKIEKQTKTILNQADKIADFVKYFEGNECRKGLTAKPCHCEAPKKELSTLKQSIDESHRRYVPVDAIGFKAWNLTKDSRAIANDVYGQSITVALLELKDGE